MNLTEPKNIDELKKINYEIFIWLITALAVFNFGLILLAQDDSVISVAVRVNRVLSLIFLLDFLHRLRTAHSKRHYFINQFGWLDLIGSVPVFGMNLARIMRLIRTNRALRRIGWRKALHEVATHRADTALLSIILCAIFLLQFGSIAILKAEADAEGALIVSADDAFWWVVVTIATVGYGDEYPVTEAGRFVGVVVIVAGVGLFGTLSGFLAQSFMGKNAAQDEESVSNNEILSELRKLRQENVDMRQSQSEMVEEIQQLKSAVRKKQEGDRDE